MSDKMKFIISFEDEFGIESNKVVEVKVDVPNFHEFKSIDQVEKIMLAARKEASTKAIELYLEEVSKKKSILRTKDTKEK
jgi:hypothetical protein